MTIGNAENNGIWNQNWGNGNLKKTCLPIYFVVSVSWYVYSLTQIVSKAKTVKIKKAFAPFRECWMHLICQRKFPLNSWNIIGGICCRRSPQLAKCLSGLPVLEKIVSPVNRVISKYKFKTITGKYLEDIRCKLVVSSMYKLITCGRDADGLSIRFDRE